MDPVLEALTQRLEELVGQDESRGLHVVVVRESWLEWQPLDWFNFDEPTYHSVADVARRIHPGGTMQERVCWMCRVGAFWPLCLARALEQLREADRPHETEPPPPHEWERLGLPPPPNLPTQADLEADFWLRVDPWGIGRQFVPPWDSDEEDPGPPPWGSGEPGLPSAP